MQTLLYAFHKDIISLNLYNNPLVVDICSPIIYKKKMSSEGYISCLNHIAMVGFLIPKLFSLHRVYFPRHLSTSPLEKDCYIFLIAYFFAPKQKA